MAGCVCRRERCEQGAGRLARGEDDADGPLFERALVMEGDTEYGLILKNTRDAIGPLMDTAPSGGPSRRHS